MNSTPSGVIPETPEQSIQNQAAARRDAWLLLAIMLGASILRLINLNAEYWLDELWTVQTFVRLRPAEILTTYASPNNHVLNTWLAHACRALGGEAPWVIRLPALAFGIAGVGAFYYTAISLYPRWLALLGTALLAVSYPHIYYSQNARGYSALMFFGMLGTGLMLRLAEEPEARRSRRQGLALALTLGLGVYAQLVLAVAAVAQAAVLAAARRWRALGWAGLGGIIAAGLYAPMGADLIRTYVTAIAETGNPLFSKALLYELRPIWPLLPVAAIVGPLLVWSLARRAPLAAMLLVAPIAATVLFPAVRGQGVSPRMFLFALPVAYLFLLEAFAVIARWWRLAPAVGAAVVAAASVVLLVPYYQLPKQGFQQALRYVAAHQAEGDERLGLTLAGKACRFYDPTLPLVDSPEELAHWLAGAHPRTWVILTFKPDMHRRHPSIEQWVQQATVHRATFPGAVQYGEVYVHLWEPPGSPKNP